jgi:hypothetical protein
MAQMTPEEFAAGAQQALGREPIKPAPKPLKTTQPPAKPEAKPRAGGLAGGRSRRATDLPAYPRRG